jgi:preflagellin peptidase FlaK
LILPALTTYDEVRILACGAMLVLASVIDIRKREIPDKVWLGFGGLGILMAILDVLNGTFRFGYNLGSEATTTFGPNNNLMSYLLGVGLIAPIAYAIYRTGLYGGADSKALVVIAILVPPFVISGLNVASIHGFSALTVLTNAVLLSVGHICYNIVRNSLELARGSRLFEGFEESTTRKVLAFAVGYRSSAPRGYLYAMECVDNDSGKLKFRFNPAAYDDFVEEQTGSNEHMSTPEDLRRNNAKRVWVTQALPFIVYIAAGFGAMLVVGDFMALLIQALS